MRVIKSWSTDFTIIPNEIYRHNISLKALGLYTYIAQKPDSWNFSIGGTSSQVGDGKDSIRSAIKELEKAGFLARYQKREKDGTLGDGVWMIYDKPTEKREAENPTSVPSRLVNTNIVNTIKEKSDERKTEYEYQESSQITEDSLYSEGEAEFLLKKARNKAKKSLKQKYGGSIPPWVDVPTALESIEVPITVSINKDFREFCESISKDRKAFHLPSVEGQVLWNKLLEDGWKPAQIKCACRIAYRVDPYWKDNFNPVSFFRRTNKDNNYMSNVEKFVNYRSEGDPTITNIKEEMKNELKDNT